MKNECFKSEVVPYNQNPPMKKLQLLICSLFLLICGTVQTQVNNTVLDSLYKEVEFLIGDSWFFEETKDGFKVTFCRSCKDAYNNYLDTTSIVNRPLNRASFFKEELIDSIANYSLVSVSPSGYYSTKEEKNTYNKAMYKPNGILSFNVRIEKKWSEKKWIEVLSRNNQLKDSILKEPLYKTNMGIFSDYRCFLPEDYLKQRTSGLDFYFERLPYESSIINKSIFIDPNITNYFSRPMLVDRNDPNYYEKNENKLLDERNRTLKIIALTLGIHDYKILN